MDYSVATRAKTGAEDLETELNDFLIANQNHIVDVVGANYSYGNDKNRGSIFIQTDDGDNGRSCKVKLWAKGSSDNLRTAITAFLESTTFVGKDPVLLTLDYSNDKWRAMLVYYTTGGSVGVNYDVIIAVNKDKNDFDDSIMTELDRSDKPVLYAYTYGGGKHRGVLIANHEE